MTQLAPLELCYSMAITPCSITLPQRNRLRIPLMRLGGSPTTARWAACRGAVG